MKLTEIRVFIDPIISMSLLQIVMSDGHNERLSQKIGEQRIKHNNCIEIAEDERVDTVSVKYFDGEIFGLSVTKEDGSKSKIETSSQGKWFDTKIKDGH